MNRNVKHLTPQTKYQFESTACTAIAKWFLTGTKHEMVWSGRGTWCDSYHVRETGEPYCADDYPKVRDFLVEHTASKAFCYVNGLNVPYVTFDRMLTELLVKLVFRSHRSASAPHNSREDYYVQVIELYREIADMSLALIVEMYRGRVKPKHYAPVALVPTE